MASAWYQSVSHHCLRYYARHPKPGTFPDESSRHRWEACSRAVTEADADIVTLFAQTNTKAAIYDYARKKHVPEGKVWSKVRDLERRVAGELGIV